MKNRVPKTDLQKLRNGIINQVNQIEDESSLRIALAYISRIHALSASQGAECK